MDSFVETDNNCLNESSRSIGIRENNIFVDTGFRRRWDIRVKIPVAFWSVIKGSFIYAVNEDAFETEKYQKANWGERWAKNWKM